MENNKNIQDCVFIIQARINSQRVKKKMIKKFANTTLIEIAIKKILNSQIIPKEQFYLSVYDKELIDIGNKYNLNIFKRSYKSSETESNVQDLYEWHDKLNYKYVIFINPCSPFLKTETIDKFTEHFLNIKEEGLFGVIGKKNYFWDKQHNLITKWPEGFTIMNTKYVEKTYEAAHCLYASKLDIIKENKFMGSFQKNDPVLFEMDEFESFDIDYPWQFKLAESYYSQYYTKPLAVQ